MRSWNGKKNTFKFVVFNLNSIEHFVMKTCYLSYFQIKILGSTFSVHFTLYQSQFFICYFLIKYRVLKKKKIRHITIIGRAQNRIL